MKTKNKINIHSLVGSGYNKFWTFKGRYRVVKGSRRSKKSKTMALWTIYNIMKQKDSNMLVVRKTYRTLKDSCFTELKWAIHQLQADDFWQIKEAPLEMIYIPTGQRILFRGLDDPLKVTSIAVEVGVLCWIWIEEAYEISKEEDFDTLTESIMGDCPEHLYKQITLTFNPWNEKIWLKKRFFDVSDPDILALTTNYTCNEWLSESDKKLFEKMKEINPRRYQVAGLGNWGIAEGLIFENFEERFFTVEEIAKLPGIQSAFGLDFGYTNDPTAVFCGLIDVSGKVLYVFDEIYKRGMSNEDIAAMLIKSGYSKEHISADSAEPKSIARLYDLGITHIQKANKGKDSINNGIDFLQDYKIIIHPKCVNFITEISNYTWDTDKKTGNKLNKPIDDFNHLMDAMRYAVERFAVGSTFSFE